MSPGITIIGLGPGDSQYWTRTAYTRLNQAREVYLRTAHHPSVADISAQTHSFDGLYEQSHDLNQAHDQLATAILRLGQGEEGVIYAVPGHPGVSEATVSRIRALAQANQVPVTIIPGLSLLESTLMALNLDGLVNLQLSTAMEIAQRRHPPLAPDRPALVAELSNQALAAKVKRTLLNAYPDDLMVTLVRAAGAELWTCSLAELDRQLQLDASTILYLPAEASHTSLATFQETIAHLRAPEGCPWDREQTHQSLRPFLLEETYEVLEALDAADSTALAEELGDLLLQIVLHTQIATETGTFKMGQVISHIQRKLLRRHPHVFSDVVVSGVEEVTTNWEAIKQAERSNAKVRQAAIPSVLDGIPAVLPALAQALAISKRVVRVGFEWPNIEGVLDKLVEEAREIVEATDPAQVEAEIGDLLFSAVNLARWRNVDPESALRTTNARFIRRFKKVEELATVRGKPLPEMTLAEMDALWDEVKNSE